SSRDRRAARGDWRPPLEGGPSDDVPIGRMAPGVPARAGAAQLPVERAVRDGTGGGRRAPTRGAAGRAAPNRGRSARGLAERRPTGAAGAAASTGRGRRRGRQVGLPPGEEREYERVLGRIRESPVVYEPFPHIEVPELLSDEFYAALMAELPPVSEYKPAAYAGTAPTYDVLDTESFNTSTPVEVPEECRKKDGADKRCFFRTRQLHEDGFTTGLVFKAGKSLERRYPLWTRMYELFYSLNFTRALVEKFTLDDGKGIPAWKRAKWNLTHGSLKNSAALRIEPSHYHLAPHVDIMEKLITWQFFHPEDTPIRLLARRPEGWHVVLQAEARRPHAHQRRAEPAMDGLRPLRTGERAEGPAQLLLLLCAREQNMARRLHRPTAARWHQRVRSTDVPRIHHCRGHGLPPLPEAAGRRLLGLISARPGSAL
ncbi:unnamed protein product, partial [Prorocentrum cordatum]